MELAPAQLHKNYHKFWKYIATNQKLNKLKN